MQLHKELVLLLQGAQIVNGQTLALRHRSDRLKQVLPLWRPRFGMHHYVRGNDFSDTLLDGVSERVNLLKTGGACDTDGRVNEMAVPGPANTHAIDIQHSIHTCHGPRDFLLQAFGRHIQERLDGSLAES